MNFELDSLTATILVVTICFFALVFLVALARKIRDFNRMLAYINQEIGRTTGGEQIHWIHEKRRLLLSLLPFYRRKK